MVRSIMTWGIRVVGEGEGLVAEVGMGVQDGSIHRRRRYHRIMGCLVLGMRRDGRSRLFFGHGIERALRGWRLAFGFGPRQRHGRLGFGYDDESVYGCIMDILVRRDYVFGVRQETEGAEYGLLETGN